VKVHIDRDVEGHRPEMGQLDREGKGVEDRIYNAKDFDRTLGQFSCGWACDPASATS
jgi:type I restriction enzyme R subunit